MKGTHYYNIETPDGDLLIEHGFLTTISVGGNQMSKKWSLTLLKGHEFVLGGALYQIKFRWALNPLKNLGFKCFVRRNGQVVADNPDHSGVNLISTIIYVIASLIVGVLIGLLFSVFILGILAAILLIKEPFGGAG